MATAAATSQQQLDVALALRKPSLDQALPGELPAASLADVVGVPVNTAAAWAEIAGRPWGDYPTLREASERPRWVAATMPNDPDHPAAISELGLRNDLAAHCRVLAVLVYFRES
jgi:hypothetical protein